MENKDKSGLIYDDSEGDWILDTDPGIDDAFAITLSISFLKDKLKLISVTAGNTGVDQCLINTKKLCVFNEKKYNISKGDHFTISNSKNKGASFIHGEDGLFDFSEYNGMESEYDNLNNDNTKGLLKQHSAIEIIRLSKNYNNKDKKLNIIAIGPLTNIALALMLDPSLPKRINKMVIMGGSIESKGNICPLGEFNFAVDNISVKKVLQKIEIIVIYPWETCWKNLLLLENCDFDDRKNQSKKRIFIEKTINEKMKRMQMGVFCDYGAAVAAYYPRSVKSSKNVFCDIEFATSENHASRLLISEDIQMFQNKNTKKVEIVMDVYPEIFFSMFNNMIN